MYYEGLSLKNYTSVKTQYAETSKHMAKLKGI